MEGGMEGPPFFVYFVINYGSLLGRKKFLTIFAFLESERKKS